jgi:hypothetical protein
MNRYRGVAEVEADLSSLRAAAERAGLALACLFSCSSEFEAAVIRARREAGAFAPRRGARSLLWTASLTLTLSFVFLML